MIVAIIFFVSGVALGALFSWYFTRLYYLRAKKDTYIHHKKTIVAINKRAMENIKELAENKSEAENIIRELYEVLTKRHGKGFMKDRCPYCGSDDIRVEFIESELGSLSILFCGECWREISR